MKPKMYVAEGYCKSCHETWVAQSGDDLTEGRPHPRPTSCGCGVPETEYEHCVAAYVETQQNEYDCALLADEA